METNWPTLFLEQCLKNYNIESFRRRGKQSYRRLERIAYDLQKIEKDAAQKKIDG